MSKVNNNEIIQQNSISVVVPVFLSGNSLSDFLKRCRLHLDSLTQHWEIILVVDASPDESWSVACQHNNEDLRVKCINLSRNHGQQFATLIGLKYASKRYVVTIDDDLQCWPEDIGKFIAALNTGYSLVIGAIPANGKQHNRFRNIGSTLNRKLVSKILNKPKSLKLSSFRAMHLSVAKKLASYNGPHPHITAMLLKAVPHTKIINAEIRHSPRHDGEATTYSFRKLAKTVSYLIINHSYIPLRMMVVWGVIISIASTSFAFWVLVKVLFSTYTLPGWASITVLVSFLSGNVLMALGILGEYIGRLVEQSSHVAELSVFEERL